MVEDEPFFGLLVIKIYQCCFTDINEKDILTLYIY